MRSHSSILGSQESIPVRKGIVSLSGYGLRVAVEHGRLCLSDGIGASRRQARFSRATSGIRRLVLLGHSGVISLESLRWLHDVRAAMVQIDADGKLVLANAPLTEGLTHLRRAQVVAAGTECGWRIVSKLLADKVRGQADVAHRIGAEATARVLAARADHLGQTTSIRDAAKLEGQAARTYWEAWAPVRLSFVRHDARKVPEHWTTFGARRSPITNSPRNAANPGNAVLNYLYAILEAETRIALLTLGLDPGLGLLHADLASRDSLACDVMEAVRPKVDSWLLDFLARNSFARKDFFERADGTVRLTSRLTVILAETAPEWARQVAPIAEWVASTLMWEKGRTRGLGLRNGVLPTPLTQSKRSLGRHVEGPNSSPAASPGKVARLRLCHECGRRITKGKGRFCSEQCFQSYKREVDIPRFAKAGIQRLAELRAKGADPTHGGDVGRRRGLSNARRARERAEWEKLGLDLAAEKQRFKKDILPALQGVPLSRIIKATGLSRRYVSMIRRGMHIPHPMHYRGLTVLLNSVAHSEL